MTLKTCPECGAPRESFDKDYKRCETVCRRCGLVIEGPPGYVAGRIKLTYPGRYTYESTVRDADGHIGLVTPPI